MNGGKSNLIMTREEQKRVRELSKAIEKDIRPNCKEYGYKCVSGFIYKVVNDYLYEVIISVPPIGLGRKVNVKLWCKPLAIDDMFWKVFDMFEEAKKQPFSFHVRGAFTPYCHTLEEWSSQVSVEYDTKDIFATTFKKVNGFLDQYTEKFQTIEDFKQELINKKSKFTLNILLCELCEENYQKVLECLNDESMKQESGGFADAKGGDIYDYIRRYCEARV